MLESDITRMLRRAVVAAGGLIYKVAFEGGRDCPDYLVLIDGGAYLVETKRPGGRPRPSQVYTFARIKAVAGVEVHVVSNASEISAFIQQVLRKRDTM